MTVLEEMDVKVAQAKIRVDDAYDQENAISYGESLAVLEHVLDERDRYREAMARIDGPTVVAIMARARGLGFYSLDDMFNWLTTHRGW